MSPGQKIRTAFAVLVLVPGAATAAIDDNPRQPAASADARLARILKEWEQRSSSRTSIDIRFLREDREKNWGDKESFTGRVVLLPKGLALVEFMNRDRSGRVASTERLVWTPPARVDLLAIPEDFDWDVSRMTTDTPLRRLSSLVRPELLP